MGKDGRSWKIFSCPQCREMGKPRVEDLKWRKVVSPD